METGLAHLDVMQEKIEPRRELYLKGTASKRRNFDAAERQMRKSWKIQNRGDTLFVLDFSFFGCWFLDFLLLLCRLFLELFFLLFDIFFDSSKFSRSPDIEFFYDVFELLNIVLAEEFEETSALGNLFDKSAA